MTMSAGFTLFIGGIVLAWLSGNWIQFSVGATFFLGGSYLMWDSR